MSTKYIFVTGGVVSSIGERDCGSESGPSLEKSWSQSNHSKV